MPSGRRVFAALTAIFGKVGVTELNSDLATFIRHDRNPGGGALLVWARDEWQRPDTLSSKGVIFLVLSGAATGLSWLCYNRALQLAPPPRGAHRQVERGARGDLAWHFWVSTLTWRVGIGAGFVGRRRTSHGPLKRSSSRLL